jgi:hypothetical protein
MADATSQPHWDEICLRGGFERMQNVHEALLREGRVPRPHRTIRGGRMKLIWKAGRDVEAFKRWLDVPGEIHNLGQGPQ